MTEIEPRVWLLFDHPNGRVNFAIESASGQFRIYVKKGNLANLFPVEAILRNQVGFVENDTLLTRVCSREEIHNVLNQLASSLASLPGTTA